MTAITLNLQPTIELTDGQFVVRFYFGFNRYLKLNSVYFLYFEREKTKNEVLYYLPITRKWLFRLIPALILICHFI